MRCAACHADNPAGQSYCGSCGQPLWSEHAAVGDASTAEWRGASLDTGSTFAGRYQVVEEVGRGGMGRVYKAVDTRVKERIAIKVLPPDLAADHASLERFARELQLARRITHRNVCRLFDLGESQGTHYLTMEFVPGEDLKRLMRQVGGLGAGKIVRIARDVCDGLAEAHRLGIVHRDLKPQNIMVDEDGSAKILDFGIATSARSRALTGPGVLIGTPHYMSPEQVDGSEVDPRADLYAMGVILYEMATGQVPFDGDTPLSVAHKQKYESPADPRKHNPQLSPDLAAVIMKCLAKDKAARYQSASELKADLDRVEQGLPTTERALSRKHTTSTQITIPVAPRWLLAAAGALTVALVVLFAWRPWASSVPISSKTGKPAVAVTWFDNQSDRAGLDRVLVTMLTTNLSQDAGLEVVSTQRMYDILRLIGKADAKAIDRTVATDVATRAGAGTMVTGTVVKLGEQVRITAELVNVASGAIIATMKEDGKGLEDVIPMVDRLTVQVRSRLGLSTASRNQPKLADVSTGSLEAYEHFQKGMDLLMRFRSADAVKELEQAVASDREFAGAWVALAQARVGLTFVVEHFADAAPGLSAIQEARKHQARATERERLQADLLEATLQRREERVLLERSKALLARYPDDTLGASYLLGVLLGRGDWKGAREAVDRYLELKPAEPNAYNLLAYISLRLGDYPSAVSAIKKYMSLYPDVFNSLDSAWEIYNGVRQFDDALKMADKYRESRPGLYGPSSWRGITFLLRGDPDGARREFLAGTVPTPAARVTQALDIGNAYLAEGRYRETESAFRKASTLADEMRRGAAPGEQTGQPQQLRARVNLGQVLAVQRRTAAAVSEFQAAEGLLVPAPGSINPYVILMRHFMGWAEAVAGHLDAAARRSREIRELVKGHDLNPQLADLAELLAALVAEAQGDQGSLRAAVDRVTFAGRWNSTLYWRLAADRAALDGDHDLALSIYDRISRDIALSRPYMEQPFMFFYERSHLAYTLGRFYEQQKDGVKARAQYSQFLASMAKADPGVPEVEDAKKRLAALGRR